MSNVTESAMEFTVLTPLYLQHVLHALHGLAFLACWLNGLSIATRALLALLIAGIWLRNFNAAVRLYPYYLSYTASQRWFLSYDGHEFLPIFIEPVSVVNSMMLVIRYKAGIADKTRSRSLFITRHSMPVTDYRRLLVRLKLSRIDQNK